MSRPTCRLLSYAVADGPRNMAADETLLEAAAAGVASLRFYGWTEATLSLGYFQPERLRHDKPLLANLPFVRRPSGGAALVHHHEVTYALGLPAGPPWQKRGESWLCRMHGIIAAALAFLGVKPRTCCADEERKLDEVFCFLHQTPGDLLVGQSKVVGSAQRKQRGALMQHGGILLAASPFTPELPGIAELSGRRLAVGDVSAAATAEFARRVGCDLVARDWTKIERKRIAELTDTKYASAAWNLKR
jgi:lipoate-protein ligase A